MLGQLPQGPNVQRDASRLPYVDFGNTMCATSPSTLTLSPFIQLFAQRPFTDAPFTPTPYILEVCLRLCPVEGAT